MPISNADAQATYQQARDALDAISRSGRASDEQKQAARRERDTLDVQFIGKNIDEVRARTALFESFIRNMESLISSLSTDAMLRGMKGLTEALSAAKSLKGGR